MTAAEPLPIFVYGTLQRGEARERCWPRAPARIELATTGGRLYDVGPYPALVEGDGEVLGELWHFAPADLDVTLAELDRIEWYGQGDRDLYVRRIVPCRTLSGRWCRAFTYFYARPEEMAGRRPVAPGPDGRCRWRGKPPGGRLPTA